MELPHSLPKVEREFHDSYKLGYGEKYRDFATSDHAYLFDFSNENEKLQTFTEFLEDPTRHRSISLPLYVRESAFCSATLRNSIRRAH